MNYNPRGPVPGLRAAPDSDRRLRQADRMARILRVLQLIQGWGRYDAKAIAQELEVAERTVYRDLVVLQLAGIPWMFDKQQKYYTLQPDFRFPTLNLTDEEILGQATATVLSEASGLKVNSGAKPTTEKLAATNGNAERILHDARQFIEVLGLKLADRRQHQDIIRTVQRSLIERKQINGIYVSPYEPVPVNLTLHPYRLALIKAAWYVIGRPSDRELPRTYRVARFKSLRMIDDPATIPDDFDLTAYLGDAWGVYRGNKTYDVELRFVESAADVVLETNLHPTQKSKKHRDGSVTLFFRIDGLNEIVRWIVGWAGRVQVIRPTELRQLVADQHQAGILTNSVNELSERAFQRGAAR